RDVVRQLLPESKRATAAGLQPRRRGKMPNAVDYRAQALACLQHSQQTQNMGSKILLLRLAKAWIELADHAQRDCPFQLAIHQVAANGTTKDNRHNLRTNFSCAVWTPN